MTKYFPYDFYSLKDVSLGRWSDGFFWPVARETTQNILLDFVEENKRMVNELGDGFEGDCLLIYNQTWNPYIRISNYLLVLDRLRAGGYSPSYSERSTIMRYLHNGGDFPMRKENLGALVHEDVAVRGAKNLLLSVRHNHLRGNHKIWHHFNNAKSAFVMPDKNVLHAPSTSSDTDWIRIISPEEWLSGYEKAQVDKRRLNSVRDLAKVYHDYALIYMRDKLGLDVPEHIARDLLEFHAGYLENIAQAYQAIRERVARKCPAKLFVGTGKTYTKALSLAVREHGGLVRGHPHGYFMCHSASYRPHVHEFPVVNEFAVYTQSLKTLFERNLSQFPPPRENQVSFVSQDSNEFRRFRNLYKHDPIPAKIKRVMILELQLWADDIRYEISETMINYQFYYKLCKILIENGYEVIFKKRPKSWDWQGADFFRDMPGVKLVYGSLEDPEVMNMADAIMFQYGLSSTFVPLVCTNKTLIYIDAGWEAWYSDVYELLQKRCSVLRCCYDDANRQQFDPQDLLDILSQKPREPNMDFFETYLEP